MIPKTYEKKTPNHNFIFKYHYLEPFKCRVEIQLVKQKVFSKKVNVNLRSKNLAPFNFTYVFCFSHNVLFISHFDILLIYFEYLLNSCERFKYKIVHIFRLLYDLKRGLTVRVEHLI